MGSYAQRTVGLLMQGIQVNKGLGMQGGLCGAGKGARGKRGKGKMERGIGAVGQRGNPIQGREAGKLNTCRATGVRKQDAGGGGRQAASAASGATRQHPSLCLTWQVRRATLPVWCRKRAGGEGEEGGAGGLGGQAVPSTSKGCSQGGGASSILRCPLEWEA
jgi:hypothetical protein